MNDNKEYPKVYACCTGINMCDDIGYMATVEYVCPQCQKKKETAILISADELFNKAPETHFNIKCDFCGLSAEGILKLN